MLAKLETARANLEENARAYARLFAEKVEHPACVHLLSDMLNTFFAESELAAHI